MAEKVFSDFSGGMNALAAVDKLDPRECLLAENVRLDETGNVLSAGAATKQNTAALGSKIHSLYWNPGFGAVAGVDQNVFQGPTLGGMTSALAGQNASQQKMSFASAPNRVYFDVGSVGYWSDQVNLLAVDWAPPLSVSAGATGPDNGTLAGSGTVGTATGFGFALSTSPVQGVQFTVVCTTVHTNSVTQSTLGISASLMVNGVVVGTSVAPSNRPSPENYGFFPSGVVETFTFGGPSSLFGDATLTPAQVNAANFGVVFRTTFIGGDTSYTRTLSAPQCTAYQQSSGFTAGTGGGGALTGTYTWKITFVAANGEESDGSVEGNAVVLSAQSGTITSIPPGDARTTSRNIYRKGGTLSQHYLVGSIPDNVSTTFSDNQTDSLALTAGVILAGDVPGDYPNSRLGGLSVRFPALHYDRVFWVNQQQSNQIVWSKPLNGFAYPVINFINVGDGKPISRIISIFGELIIIKTDSIWRLTGNDETSFDLTQTPSAVGTDMSFTIAALPDKIIFANRWGLWVFNGYTSVPLTTKLDLWFKQDDRTNEELFGVNGFHPPEVASATVPLNFDACGNSEKYYLAYAEAGQTSNNAALVFDVKHGNITKRAGVIPLSLAIDQVTGFVYVGDNSGFVSLLDDWNGTGLANFDFQTAYIDLERGSNKTLWALEFFIDTDGQSITPSVYYDNGNASETLPAISTTKLQRVVRPCEASTARKMQNFSVRLNGSINPVNRAGQPQIQFVHVKALYDLRAGRARTGQ